MIKKAKNAFRNPLLMGSAIMIGGSMGLNVINYFYHLVMGRVLGPAGYGDLASIFSLLYIISIVPLSASFAIVRFISVEDNAKSKAKVYHALNKLIFYVGIVGGIFIVLASPLISDFLRLSDVLSVALVGPIFFFLLITLVNKSTLQGMLKFVGVVTPEYFVSLIKLLLGLLLVYLGYSVAGAVGAIFVGVIVSYVVSVWFIRREKLLKAKDKYNYKPFIKYSFPVLLQALAFTSFFTLDIILVKHFFSPVEAGLYAAIATLGKIIFFATQPITSVMFPIVSSKRSRGEVYRKVFYASLIVTGSIAGVVLLLYYIFPKVTITMLYGDKYSGAENTLFAMGLFISLYTLAYLVTNFLLSIDKVKIVALPIVLAVFQAIAIWKWHESILQVIQVNIATMILLILGLMSYVGYSEIRRYNAK